MKKEELIALLNHALELEHAAYAQYLSHAENISGEAAEPIIARLKEIANDEKKHQEQFRKLIGILGGVPGTGMAQTHSAKTVKEILEQNLKDEKEAIDAYKKIHEALKKENGGGYYNYLLKHAIKHIIIDEQEHVTELELLAGAQGSSF